MPDTDRLINKAQGDDIITALNGITSRLQEMYTVDDALSSTSEHPVQNKVVKEALDNKADESDLADKADKSDIASTKTATGNPITLTDAAPINAESLVVEFSPKQDLHGQSAPYVGGAGKNKLPMTVDGIKAANTEGTWTGNAYALNGVTFTINTDADGNVTSLKVNGTASATIFFKLCDFPACLTDGTSYKINGNAIGYGSSTAYMQVQTSSGGGVANVGEEYTLSYTSGGTAQRLIIRIDTNESASNLVFYPMIRLATETDPTFAPWENICPITGYTECEVDDVGKNILEPTAETQIIGQVTFTKNSDGTYTINGTASETIFFYPCGQYASFDMNGKTISGCPSGGSTGSYWFSFSNSNESEFDTGNGAAVTREVSGAPVFIMLQGASLNNAVLKPMICSSSEENPTSYEPYHSSNATIQFGQTVYGGSVDFLTGVLTVDSGIIASYNGETLPSTWISDRDVYVAGTTPTTGAQVCYNLAEPTTIQLTPTELKLLLKYNNITTNGTTITLGYQPDNVIGELKGEIQQCIPDPYYMTFDVDSNITDAVPIIFDQATHDYNIVGDGWKDKTFLCIESVDMRMGTLQRILSSDICFVDSALKTILLFPYIRAVEQNVKLSITESSGTYKLSYQSTADASATDYIKFRVRVFN